VAGMWARAPRNDGAYREPRTVFPQLHGLSRRCVPAAMIGGLALGVLVDD
jgi:hypothetical protein